MQDLRTKLDRECLPSNTFEVDRGNSIVFFSMVDDDKGQPHLSFSVVVREDMHFKLWSEDGEISVDKVIHLSPFGRIDTCAQLQNILAFMKSMAAEPANNKVLITQCMSLLDKVQPEDGNGIDRKVAFVKEQLTYMVQKKPRYSPQLLATAAMWHLTSPVLYRTILKEEVLALPTERYAQILYYKMCRTTSCRHVDD